MVREPLSAEDRERGVRLGRALRLARGGRTMAEIAAAAGMSVETVRKIERGRVPTPAFFTVVALARAVGISLPELCTAADGGTEHQSGSGLRDDRLSA